MAQSNSKDIPGMMEEWFAKAPALPKNAQEGLVKIVPWIALIFGVLGVIAGVGAVGVSPVALFAGVGASSTVLISGIASIVASGMMLIAYPSLKSHKAGGWNLLFWSEAVSLVSTLLTGAYVGGILGALIGYYLLFQIKSYYK